MVGLPVVALGTQPSGGLSLIQVRKHIQQCRSRKRYQITCFECGIPHQLPENSHATQFAYARAKAALAQWPEAAVGIGLHSASTRMLAGNKIVMVRVAAAALVMHGEPDSPIILSTSDNSSRETARMVAHMMRIWQKKLVLSKRQEPLIFKVVRRAIGL